MKILREQDELEEIRDQGAALTDQGRLGHGPAKYWRLKRTGMKVGFIGAMTDEHFCDNCNKMRLTADGFIRPCLGQHGELDIKPALRGGGGGERGSEGKGDGAVDKGLDRVLRQALAITPPAHRFRENFEPGRIMTAIGG